MIEDVSRRVNIEDPVRGGWSVQCASGYCKVWCDASMLATGVVIEVDGVLIEDAAWLRKSTGVSHVNVAELDAVLKGVNLAIKWGFKTFEIVTDYSGALGQVSARWRTTSQRIRYA